MPVLDRQPGPVAHPPAGLSGRPPRSVPEARPTPLQAHYVMLSVPVLLAGATAITALEFGAPLGSPLVKLCALVGAPLLLLTGGDFLSGTGNGQSNAITGNDLENVIAGLGGMDVLDGKAGDDELDGGDGDDILLGGEGDDVLSGGTGNDRLDGGAGQDIFVFRRGDGNDSIDDAVGPNAVEFDGAILPGDLAISEYLGDDGASYLHVAYGAGDAIDIANGAFGAIDR